MFVVRRENHNPVLSPRREHPWEERAVYNPSAIRTKEGVRIFYRALGDADTLVSPHQGLSTVGTAFARDGVHFTDRRQVIVPQEDWEKFGCEDPRVTLFEGKYYCFYTALGGYPFGPDNIKVAVAVGEDPLDFTERHLVTPFNAKAATLFPERVKGKVVLLLTAHTDWTQEHPRPTIGLAFADNVEDFYNPGYWEDWHSRLSEHAIPELRRTEADHIEVGATPVMTDAGWLLIYSYIEDYYDEKKRLFTIETALLHKDDPHTLVARTESALVPEDVYEIYGLVPNIVFPSGATIEPARGPGGTDTLEIWYGAADTVCAKACVRLDDLIDALRPEDCARVFTRARGNPILTPRGSGAESRDTFNAAAVDLDGTIYILYREMDGENTSRIGCALSKDGIHIDERLPDPVYVPRAEFELKKGSPTGNSGCEDPRIVRIDDMLYMTYTAYDGAHPPKGAVSMIPVEDFKKRDFSKWSMPELLTPEGIDDKDVALLPEKVHGSFLLYHRIDNRVCADFLSDLTSGRRVTRCLEILEPRRGMWDGAKVGVAGPPAKVTLPDGTSAWLFIYHGVSRHGTYRLGAALLAHSGLELISRTADAIFEPEALYEKEGEVKNVVFSCGHVIRDDTVFLYYGAADKVLGVATASLSRILKALS